MELKFFNHFAFFFSFLEFNFTLLVIVSSGSDFTSSSSSSSGDIASSLSKYKLRVRFSSLFKTFILFFRASESLSYRVAYVFRTLSYNSEAVASTTFLF